MHVFLTHPSRCCDCAVKFRELLHRLWVLTASLAWVWFLVLIQRKRQRSLIVGNGSGASVCPPVVTVAWGHVRALALELSANKPPRLRSVRFPATGRSNLEVSIALSRDLLCFLLKHGAGNLCFLLSSANVLVKGLFLYCKLISARTSKASEGSFFRAKQLLAERPYNLLVVNAVFEQRAEVCSPVVYNPI